MRDSVNVRYINRKIQLTIVKCARVRTMLKTIECLHIIPRSASDFSVDSRTGSMTLYAAQCAISVNLLVSSSVLQSILASVLYFYLCFEFSQFTASVVQNSTIDTSDADRVIILSFNEWDWEG